MWRHQKQLEKQMLPAASYAEPLTQYHQNVVQEALIEGVRRIKNKLQSSISSGKLETELKNTDLVLLADNEADGGEKTAGLLKSLHVGPEISRNQIIDKRINDYYALQQHKLKREELRKQRGK